MLYSQQWASPQLTLIIGTMHNGLKTYNLKFIAALTALVACNATFASPALARPVSQKYAALYKEMLAASLNADKLLVNDMQTVAQTLQEFADSQGHFPNTGDDINGMSLELSAVLPKNPYTNQESKVSANADMLDGYSQEIVSRAQIIYDPSLAESIVDKLATQPSDTWKAKPGTVVAVTNGYDLCLVWAAGIDERPVRDESGKVRLSVLKTNTN